MLSLQFSEQCPWPNLVRMSHFLRTQSLQHEA